MTISLDELRQDIQFLAEAFAVIETLVADRDTAAQVAIHALCTDGLHKAQVWLAELETEIAFLREANEDPHPLRPHPLREGEV